MPPVEDAEHQEAEGEAVPLQHALDVLLHTAPHKYKPAPTITRIQQQLLKYLNLRYNIIIAVHHMS